MLESLVVARSIGANVFGCSGHMGNSSRREMLSSTLRCGEPRKQGTNDRDRFGVFAHTIPARDHFSKEQLIQMPPRYRIGFHRCDICPCCLRRQQLGHAHIYNFYGSTNSDSPHLDHHQRSRKRKDGLLQRDRSLDGCHIVGMRQPERSAPPIGTPAIRRVRTTKHLARQCPEQPSRKRHDQRHRG